MEKKVVFTGEGPQMQAPYSQAMAYSNLLFVSGQVPVDPQTNQIVYGSFEEQFRLALNNLKAILEAGGSCLENVLKVTVFLSDMDKFEVMNEIYKEYFTSDRPARSCIEASRLPFDIMVEIEAVAYIPA